MNNACDDPTPEVASSFDTRLPIRCVSELVPGLSNARNAAISAARGSHIVWTDDDVLVDARWLREYAEAFDRYPAVAFFGGPIAPWFEATPPDWLCEVLPQVSGAFAIREFIGHDEAITAAYAPFGANMAFRADVLRLNTFDRRLGRVRDSAIGGEETAVILELLARGHAGRWVPGATVRHYIPRERQTTRYLRQFYAGLGETTVRVYDDERQSRKLFGRPRWAWRAMVQCELMYSVRRLIAPPQVWVEELKRAGLARGALRRMLPDDA